MHRRRRKASSISERLFVDTEAVVYPRAGKLRDRQHPLIVLENPAELARLDAVSANRVAPSELDQHEGELACEPRSMESLGDAHQRHSRPFGPWLAQSPQQLRPVDREQLPVQVPDERV